MVTYLYPKYATAFTKDQKLAYDQYKIDVLTARSMFSSARQEGLAEGFNKVKQKAEQKAKN